MAAPVVWSPEADDDLAIIEEYIARDSPNHAHAVVSAIVAVTDDLPDFPLLGRTVPEWSNPAFRERIVKSYRLIYRVVGGKILVVAVIHGSRLLSNIDGRFSAES